MENFCPLKTPFMIGNVSLRNNILYAPLAGCSDYPFRQMSCSYRPGLVYCEMVKIDALVRNDPQTYRLLNYHPDMHPIGAQICGSKIEMALASGRIIEDLGFDIIDLNFGCPVDKVTKDGSGSAMLKHPERIGDMIAKLTASIRIPVTVKIRAGWDDQTINASQITRIAEQAGAKAITVHGRTREQGYKNCSNWDHIRDCRQAAKHILVIGNGDIFDAQSALGMFLHTQCDAILVARGTLGHPWIAEDIIRFLSELVPIKRTGSSMRQALVKHFTNILLYQNERQALLDFRRVGCWYLKGCEGTKHLRIQLNTAKTTKEAFLAIENFPWDDIPICSAQEISLAHT